MTPPPAVPAARTASLDKSGRAIRDMFAGVAPRYDLLNHLLSGALDHGWRRAAARALALPPGARVLDLCAGTGDQAVAVGKRGGRVAAADFCLPMIARARRKFTRLARRRGPGRAAPLVADARKVEPLPGRLETAPPRVGATFTHRPADGGRGRFGGAGRGGGMTPRARAARRRPQGTGSTTRSP